MHKIRRPRFTVQYLQNGNVTLVLRRTGNYKMELKGIKEMELNFHLSKKNFSPSFLKTSLLKQQMNYTNKLNYTNSKQNKTFYHHKHFNYLEMLNFIVLIAFAINNFVCHKIEYIDIAELYNDLKTDNVKKPL